MFVFVLSPQIDQMLLNSVAILLDRHNLDHINKKDCLLKSYCSNQDYGTRVNIDA